MEEIWKDIPGYNGKYQVSNTGKVRSFKRRSNDSNNAGYLLKVNYKMHSGYGALMLYDKNGPKLHLIHRLVAQAFIPNPNNFLEVNHKDEDKTNNCVDNLEWCTRSYNIAYGTGVIRSAIARSRPVEQLTIDGIHIATYMSLSFAATINNIDASSIYKCCTNEAKCAGGYKWRYST